MFRKSVVLAFNEGIVEPVQKIVYPDLTFKTNEWETLEQLFLVKGFQPPLRNFKPRSKFKMNYKVTRRNFKFKSRNRSFNDCVEIEGKGNASFIADTRSGPIIVDVINNEVLCNNIGLVYQKRSELTNASAFGPGGQNVAKPMILFQVRCKGDDCENKVVAPTKWASDKFYHPIPKWSERS